jgi:hypothetical protein
MNPDRRPPTGKPRLPRTGSHQRCASPTGRIPRPRRLRSSTMAQTTTPAATARSPDAPADRCEPSGLPTRFPAATRSGSCPDSTQPCSASAPTAAARRTATRRTTLPGRRQRPTRQRAQDGSFCLSPPSRFSAQLDLTPRFVRRHRDRTSQIQTARFAAHRNAQTTVGMGLQQRRRQPPRFAAEDQHITRRKTRAGVTPGGRFVISHIGRPANRC